MTLTDGRLAKCRSAGLRAFVNAGRGTGDGSDSGPIEIQGRTRGSLRMGRVILFLSGLIVIGIVAGGVYLMTTDIPPPTRTVERVIDDSRFPQ